MFQNKKHESQELVGSSATSGTHFFSGRIKWFSLVPCVLVVLIVAFVLGQGVFSGIQGADAASSKPEKSVPSHGTKVSKHGVTSSKHSPSPSHVGKQMPVLSVAPLSLNFSASKGTPVPASQTVTVKNNGQRGLYWHAVVSPSTATWLTTSAQKVQMLGITTSPDQPVQLKVDVNAKNLSAGTYKAQITLNGTDQQSKPAVGSPQTVAVTLTVS